MRSLLPPRCSGRRELRRAAGLAALLLAATASADAAFNLVDLATLAQGTSAVVRGPNAAGRAVGGGRPQQGASPAVTRQGLLFQASGVVPVQGPDNSDFVTVFGINDLGDLVGGSNAAAGVQAFLQAPGQAARRLAPLPGDTAGMAFAINNHQQVVGFSSGPLGQRAVTWSATGTPSALPSAGATSSRASGINDRGDVVGTVVTGGSRQPALWTASAAAQLLMLLPGHAIGEAAAVNAQGDVVGYSATADEVRRATLWRAAGVAVDLGTLAGGTASHATGINGAGDVVGTSDSTRGSRAFVWTRRDGMQDLNTLLVSPPAGLVLTVAVGISDTGAIVAVGHQQDPAEHDDHGHDHEQPIRVFLLTPTGS